MENTLICVNSSLFWVLATSLRLLQKVLAGNGHIVRLWNWEGDHLPLAQIEKFGENKKYLPGFKLPKEIIPCYKIEEALAGAEIVFFVVPSGAMEHTIAFAARSIKHNAILVDVSKGIEPNSLRLIPHVIAKHVTLRNCVKILSRFQVRRLPVKWRAGNTPP